MQRYAVTYQWIDFRNEPILIDQPEELVSADDSPAFKHIALHLLRPDEDLIGLVIHFQNNNARGVVLVHSGDDLPALELNPPPCDGVKIPVVLIKHKVGRSLLSEMQDSSKTVNIVIIRETALDCVVPEYQTPDDRQAAAAAAAATAAQALFAETPDEKPRFRGTFFRKVEKFHLTKKMKILLYDKETKQPAVMCQNRICEIFDLLDAFEKVRMDHTVNISKVKGTVGKVCDLLKTCMERNYAVDFPYHCVTVLRLQSYVLQNYSDGMFMQSCCCLYAGNLHIVTFLILSATKMVV